MSSSSKCSLKPDSVWVKYSNGTFMGWTVVIGASIYYFPLIIGRRETTSAEERRKEEVNERVAVFISERVLLSQSRVDKKISYLVYWSCIEDTCWAMLPVPTNCTLCSSIREHLSNTWYLCRKSTQHPPTAPPIPFSSWSVPSGRQLPSRNRILVESNSPFGFSTKSRQDYILLLERFPLN